VTNSPKIIFFGNEQLAQGLTRAITPSFDALIKNNYEILALVLPSEPNPKLPEPTIITRAKEAKIPIHFAKTPEELRDITKKLSPDLGVLASFGRIIPQSVIDLFPLGVLNVHPSLLPLYRGTTPIESAILNGDSKTGVSIMQLVKTMDAGPIFAQKSISLSGTESKQELYETLATLGSELLIDVMTSVINSTAKPKNQQEDQATFTAKLDKSLAPLTPKTKSATQLSREIRAFLNFPRSKFTFLNIPCTVTIAHVSDTPKSPIDLKCTDNKYLNILRLIPAGRKEMPVADFLRGIHQ